MTSMKVVNILDDLKMRALLLAGDQTLCTAQSGLAG